MIENIAFYGKIIRILMAVVIACLFVTHTISGAWAMFALVLGGLLLMTAIMGYCPIYALFKFATAKKK
jgi:hypothetical protein